MTIRRRLFLGTLAALIGLITAVGVTEVIALHSFLYGRTADTLRTEGGIAVEQQQPPGGRRGPAAGRGLSPPQLAAMETVLATRGIASLVRDSGGHVLASLASTDVPAPDTLTSPGLLPASGGVAELNAGGQHLLAVGFALPPPDEADTVVLVSTLADDDAAVATVLLVTLVAGSAAVAVAGGLTWLVTRGALTPLRRIADVADAIAAGDLGRRAGLTRTRDEIGRLGHAFDRMVGRLLEQQEAMRRFLADASHELRTPIATVRAAAQVLLRAGTLKGEVRSGVTSIREESERMSDLVNDLLLLLRGDQASDAALEPLDLAELVSGLQVRWTELAAPHPVEIHTQPTHVVGNREQLLRVVTNLVENAAKFSPTTEPVSIVVANDASHATLHVEDRGPGIAAAERERVFERFYRGDPARTRATGGTGLGLAIVRSIVDAHGGSISMEDRAGGGNRAVVRMPAAHGIGTHVTGPR